MIKTIQEYEKMNTEELRKLNTLFWNEMRKTDAILKVRELKEMK